MAAEQVAKTAPETVWELVSDAARYPDWGPCIAAGCRRPGDTSPSGPDAVQWLAFLQIVAAAAEEQSR